MADWATAGARDVRGKLACQGFMVAPFAPIHCRWMGSAASSGARRALFTCQILDVAKMGYEATHRWWAEVSVDIDTRGWRMVNQRWADNRPGRAAPGQRA